MPKVTITADADLIGALASDQELPMAHRERIRGTPAESERLGFELGSVETLVGHFAAGVELIAIATRLVAAVRRSKKPRLEIASPTGRVAVDLEGRTDEEVAELVRAALPFAR